MNDHYDFGALTLSVKTLTPAGQAIVASNNVQALVDVNKALAVETGFKDATGATPVNMAVIGGGIVALAALYYFLTRGK